MKPKLKVGTLYTTLILHKYSIRQNVTKVKEVVNNLSNFASYINMNLCISLITFNQFVILYTKIEGFEYWLYQLLSNDSINLPCRQTSRDET